MSDNFQEIRGIFDGVPGARYEKDGKFYDCKKRLIMPDGVIEEAPEVPEKVVKETPPVVESVVVEDEPAEFEELELIDRIKIKSAAAPGYLKKSEISKILEANGIKHDHNELRDDLLGRLKDSMGWTRPLEEISLLKEEDI